MLNEQAKSVAAANEKHPRWFAPMWAKQYNRVVASCRNDDQYEWRRTSFFCRLGMIFEHFGTEFDAATIYQYYVLNRIIAVERFIPAPKGRRRGHK